MRGLRSVEALPGYRGASEHLGRLHTAGDQRPGLVGPALGQGQDLDGLERHAEGLREGTILGQGQDLDGLGRHAEGLREGTILGQGQDPEGLGRHAEGLREGTSGGTGRALAGNVLWLDANPDAKSDLARARPGAVSTSVPVWS